MTFGARPMGRRERKIARGKFEPGQRLLLRVVRCPWVGRAPGDEANKDTHCNNPTMSGSEIIPTEFGGGGLPESAIEGDLLNQITSEQSDDNLLLPYDPSGSLYLYDSSVGSDYPYEVPHSVPAYLTGSTPNLGAAPLAALITGSDSNSTFGFVPSTNAMTAHGLPIEKADDLSDLALNYGPTDGVS
jgi:hypothetical protein